MPITTYTELKAAIADWLLRDDLTAVIPSFISLAEADIARNVRHWLMEERASSTVNTQYSAVPTGFISPIRLSLTGDGTYELEPAGQAELLAMRQAANDTAGRPRYYAITSGQIELFPTPGDDYTLEVLYHKRIDPLSDSTATNWLLESHPDIYLHGALALAAPYLHDDARIGIWKGLYDQGIAGLNMDSDKAKYGGSGLRMKIRSR